MNEVTQEQWTAALNGEADYGGMLFCGPGTARKVCRPSCPAKTYRQMNVIVFDPLQKANDSGYSPCERRCAKKTGRRDAKSELTASVRNMIEQHSSEKFSLKSIAQALYTNESHLIRTFKSKTGYTPLEYHNIIRCRKAVELMENPQLKLSYISDVVGYSTPALFSRIFRKQYGQSPARYRAQMGLRKER